MIGSREEEEKKWGEKKKGDKRKRNKAKREKKKRKRRERKETYSNTIRRVLRCSSFVLESILKGNSCFSFDLLSPLRSKGTTYLLTYLPTYLLTYLPTYVSTEIRKNRMRFCQENYSANSLICELLSQLYFFIYHFHRTIFDYVLYIETKNPMIWKRNASRIISKNISYRL